MNITDAHGFAEESRLRGRKSGTLMGKMTNHFAHEYIIRLFTIIQVQDTGQEMAISLPAARTACCFSS